jgi:hypothetical protein
MMRLPPRARSAAIGGAIAQSLEGFRYVWNHTRVRTIFALFAIVGIFGWSYSVLMPAFARDVLHLGEQGYGFLLGASGVGALIGALTTATFGTNISSRKLAFGGVWLLPDAPDLFLQSQPDDCDAASRHTGFGMMLSFHIQHHGADGVADEMRRVMGICLDLRRDDLR